MKAIKLSVLILPLLFFFPQLSDAQGRQMMTFDASTSMMLQEFQAMLTFEGEEVQVRMKLGRNEAKDGTDQLEQGDVILMMNGKRATDIEALKAIYEGIEGGEEIKIGVRRGNERFILNATKGDVPEGAPGTMRMTMDVSGDGTPPAIAPELGALLVNRDGKVVLERIIAQIQPDELKPLDIQGYSIKEVNGEVPEDAEQAIKLLADLEVGAEISITFEKDGDEKSIVFTKKQNSGNFSISRGNQE